MAGLAVTILRKCRNNFTHLCIEVGRTVSQWPPAPDDNVLIFATSLWPGRECARARCSVSRPGGRPIPRRRSAGTVKLDWTYRAFDSKPEKLQLFQLEEFVFAMELGKGWA